MAVGAVALFGILLLGYGSMPVRIRKISVQGMKRMTRESVLRIVDLKPDAMVGPSEVRRIEMALKRHPGFLGASVSRGLTGTLHVRLHEREPVAWLCDKGCAVAEDGIVLPHVGTCEAGWARIAGLTLVGGKVCESPMVRDALRAESLAKEMALFPGGVWRCASPASTGPSVKMTVRQPGAHQDSSAVASGWVWDLKGRRVQMGFPVDRDGFDRLARFRRAYPDAFTRARLIDVRFAERVVVKR
jgi:hypothetical protein